LVEKLATSRPETRVLYMSGYTDYPTGQHSILDSGIPLLDKPFTRDRLIRKVRAALEPKEVTTRA
jgi:two-component system, cell cycle sensor histidine kinase and response regulator CckA